MSQLEADSIITLVSAIPALLIASLSAWLAYLTLRHRNASHNDIEQSMVELVSDINPTLSRYAISFTLEAPCLSYEELH